MLQYSWIVSRNYSIDTLRWKHNRFVYFCPSTQRAVSIFKLSFSLSSNWKFRACILRKSTNTRSGLYCVYPKIRLNSWKPFLVIPPAQTDSFEQCSKRHCSETQITFSPLLYRTIARETDMTQRVQDRVIKFVFQAYAQIFVSQISFVQCSHNSRNVSLFTSCRDDMLRSETLYLSWTT